MANTQENFILQNVLDTARVISERSWIPLREGVDISSIYDAGDNGPRAAFLRYQAGASVPEHQHIGYEHILILDGSQQDGDKLYTEGMLIIHCPGTCHRIHSPNGCLALAVWEKPVSFLSE